MKGIRKLTREDLPQVADLYEYVMRSKVRKAPPGMAAYFERIFFDSPWYDPEIPSYVFEDNGQILGFAGSHVRKMFFKGKPIRMGVLGQLIADPDVRNMAVGAFLMKKYMSGPQEISSMEMCADGMRLIWENLGGKTVHINSLNYTRLFRPTKFVANQVLNRGKLTSFKGALRGTADVFDAVVRKAYKPLVTEDKPQDEELTIEKYLEYLPVILGRRALVPNYDAEFLKWQFFEMAQVESKGTLFSYLVRDAEKNDVIGWYIYQMKPQDKGHIVQVEAKKGFEKEVLNHLFADAQRRGATLLHGRVEPNIHVPLVAANRTWLHSRYDRTLIYSKSPELMLAYYSGDAMFTRMEGEFWMGFHLEPFTKVVENPYAVKHEEILEPV
jgi:Acetyltransferase (GNAT) domain